ncbi:MAG: type II toxin-antitoxin system VapC family toxin [Steroidobacteraceae bacterium]
MYLLDTNVVSELRKPKPHGGVVEWIRAAPEGSLYVSVVTLGEIQAGVEITRARDKDKAAEIERWLDDMARSYGMLELDARTLHRWAQLMHGKPDHHLEDGLIAATALVRQLTVVTRNVADFQPFGVSLINPFTKPPK